jgi:phospholipid transport system substrate-binding protein
MTRAAGPRGGWLAVASAVALAVAGPTSYADPAPDGALVAPVQALNDALIVAMRSADSSSFVARYQALAPVIERVFNLDDVLSASVGLAWPTIPASQKAELAAAFRRYTVASYVDNFNSYAGQSFVVLPQTRAIGPGEVVVQTQIIRTGKSPVNLDYVMRSNGAGWQVVDVLTDGTISRVAVQRSDFRQLLESGGVPALTAGLDRKFENLSGSMTD